MGRKAKRTFADSLYGSIQTGISAADIDAHIGHRIRTRRKALGKTQAELAQALGLSCQQIQKYERGENRMSASVLYAAARFLEVTPCWFYLDL